MYVDHHEDEIGDYGEYDYDADDSLNSFEWRELSLTLIVYGVTFILGLVGNVLIVFTTCHYKRIQTSTNVLLASLATADLLLIIFCIPIKVAKLFSYTWAFGEFLCKSIHYVQNVSTTCSVLTLTSISIERYYAIVHPIKAKYVCTMSHVRKIIVATWILAFLLATPILFTQIQLPVGSRVKAYWCVRNWDDSTLWRFQELYTLVLVLVLPTTVMGFAYLSICREVWGVMKNRKVITGGHHAVTVAHNSSYKLVENIQLTELAEGKVPERQTNAKKKESQVAKQVIYMLVLVVGLFFLCWAPILVDNVLTAYHILPKLRTGILKYMKTVFHLMAYFNSCINPVIYGFMSKTYRKSLYAALCCANKFSPRTNFNSRIVNSSIQQMTRVDTQTRNTSFR